MHGSSERAWASYRTVTGQHEQTESNCRAARPPGSLPPLTATGFGVTGESSKEQRPCPGAAVPDPQTPGQRRNLQAPEGRRRPHLRRQCPGPGRVTGERLCRQRGRLTPRTPVLRPSHSRTCPHPTIPAAQPREEGRIPHDEKDQPNPLTQRGLDMGDCRWRSLGQRLMHNEAFWPRLALMPVRLSYSRWPREEFPGCQRQRLVSLRDSLSTEYSSASAPQRQRRADRVPRRFPGRRCSP